MGLILPDRLIRVWRRAPDRVQEGHLPLVPPVVISSFMVFMLSATDIGNPVFIGGNFDVPRILCLCDWLLTQNAILAILPLSPLCPCLPCKVDLPRSGPTAQPSQAGHRIQDSPWSFLCMALSADGSVWVPLCDDPGRRLLTCMDYSLPSAWQVLFGTWMLGLKTVKDPFGAHRCSWAACQLATAFDHAGDQDVWPPILHNAAWRPGIVTGLGYAIASRNAIPAGGNALIIAIHYPDGPYGRARRWH